MEGVFFPLSSEIKMMLFITVSIIIPLDIEINQQPSTHYSFQTLKWKIHLVWARVMTNPDAAFKSPWKKKLSKQVYQNKKKIHTSTTMKGREKDTPE